MENNQIDITDSAVKKILSLTANEDDGVRLRLSVSGGGCSGFQYGFSLDSETIIYNIFICIAMTQRQMRSCNN